MKIGTLEILALLLIAFSVIKLVIVAISPRSWFMLARKIYARPEITSVAAFLLAAIVLYLLVKSGITIIHILAVSLFIVLLMVTGMASYADRLVDWAQQLDAREMWKNFWLYTVIWIALLIWGIQAIFFP